MKDNHEIDICKESKDYDREARESSCEPREFSHEEKDNCRKQPVFLCRCKCDCRKGPEPGKVLLRCGCGSGAQIPILSVNVLGTVKPLPVASVTIDTSCLRNPTTLLTFTAEIQSAIDVALRLNFLIKKSTKSGCCEYICGTHSYSDTLDIVGIQTFSFQVCDSSPCDECVTYTVEYVPIDVVLALGAAITNAQLTALAVENLC